jgi:large subunit ribosomal protein L29
MKAEELRELPVEEIVKKVDNLEEEYFNLRFQARMGQLTNPLRLRYVKRDIARAKTILNEKKGAAVKA